MGVFVRIVKWVGVGRIEGGVLAMRLSALIRARGEKGRPSLKHEFHRWKMGKTFVAFIQATKGAFGRNQSHGPIISGPRAPRT
jgi:hypothetical protein